MHDEVKKRLLLDPIRGDAVAEVISAVAVGEVSSLRFDWRLVPCALLKGSPENLMALAKAAIAARRFGLAAPALERCAALWANSPAAWCDAARAYYLSKQPEPGFRSARRALLLEPGNVEVLRIAAAWRLPTGDLEALRCLKWLEMLINPTRDDQRLRFGAEMGFGLHADAVITAKRLTEDLMKGPRDNISEIADGLARELFAEAHARVSHEGSDSVTEDRGPNPSKSGEDLSIDLRQLKQIVHTQHPNLAVSEMKPCPVCGERERLKRLHFQPFIRNPESAIDCVALRPAIAEAVGNPALSTAAVTELIRKAAGPAGIGQWIVECSACGIVYFNLRPSRDVLSRFYEREVHNASLYGRATEASWVRQKANPPVWLRSQIGPLDGLDLLDVGAGEGLMAWYSRRLGANVVGIESSPKSVAYAQRILGLDKNAQGYYGPESYDVHSFDVITCSHVLEHIEDIGPIGEAFSRHTRPGGYLLLGVPAIDVLNSDTVVGVGDEHLLGFRFGFLKNWLSNFGFDVVTMKSTSQDVSGENKDSSTGMAIWS